MHNEMDRKQLQQQHKSPLASALWTVCVNLITGAFCAASLKRHYCYVHVNKLTLMTKLNLVMLKESH